MAQEPPPQDPFELLKRMWGPMGLPLAPLLDPADIDKRIADLKSVETWLSMNMNVLRMTIQGLEMQRATLAAFQSMQPKAAAPSGQSAQPKAGPEAAVSSAADAWWTLLQQMQTPVQVPKPEAKPDAKPEKTGK